MKPFCILLVFLQINISQQFSRRNADCQSNNRQYSYHRNFSQEKFHALCQRSKTWINYARHSTDLEYRKLNKWAFLPRKAEKWADQLSKCQNTLCAIMNNDEQIHNGSTNKKRKNLRNSERKVDNDKKPPMDENFRVRRKRDMYDDDLDKMYADPNRLVRKEIRMMRPDERKQYFQ
uniref:Uncharacterized protein n=1 Tax=Romanomermis culicivorax TaxID=13658 RepID=A0A915K6V0_ROMCU